MTQARTVEELKAGLTASRRRLLAAIEGVTEEQCKRRVSEGEWCIAEMLAHLMDQERLRSERIAIALERDGATITPSSQEAHDDAARAGRTAVLPQLLHGLLATRRELERLLDRVATARAGLDRAIVHPQLGRQTIGWMVSEKVVAHELEHVAQIEELRKGLGASQPESWGLEVKDRPAGGSA